MADTTELLNNRLKMVNIAIQIKRDCNEHPIGCNTGKKSKAAFFKSIQYRPKKYIIATKKAFKKMMEFNMDILQKIKADTQAEISVAESNKKSGKTNFKF